MAMSAANAAAPPRSRRIRDVARTQAAVPRHRVEQIGLREAAHLHHGVDQRSDPVEGQGAVRLPRDPAGAAIQGGRRAAVQRDLRLTGGEAPSGGGEIEVGKADGALELEHAVPGQEEPGDVRGHGVHRSGARQRLRQEPHDRALILARHAD
jgi:hypothetical protein